MTSLALRVDARTVVWVVGVTMLAAGCRLPPMPQPDVFYTPKSLLSDAFEDSRGGQVFAVEEYLSGGTTFVFGEAMSRLFFTKASVVEGAYVATELTPATLSEAWFTTGWIPQPPCVGTVTITADTLVSTTSGSPICSRFAGTFHRSGQPAAEPASIAAPVEVAERASACGRFTACVCELKGLPDLQSGMRDALSESCTEAQLLMQSAQADDAACDGGRVMMTGLVRSVHAGELPDACAD